MTGTQKIATRVAVLAALAAIAPLGLCESLFEPVVRDARQAEIVDRIREEQALNGAYSPALIEPFTALGYLYRQGGDPPLAVAAIGRALQILRANYGLRTLDQAPLMLQWIENAEAMRDFKMAWDVEKELLLLAYKNPDDPRSVPILHEIGDKRIDLLSRYVKGEFPPQIVLGCYYDPFRIYDNSVVNEHQQNCSSGSRRVAIQSILHEAQAYYRDAILVMRRNELYSSDELREIEMDLVRTSYLYGRSATIGKESVGVVKASLRRLLEYDVANAAPPEVRIESFLRMADWDLMFANGRSESDAVLARYEAAYRELESAGVSRASIEEIFLPQTPVVLPSFLENPLASEPTSESDEHIDVAFEIDKYGHSEGIEAVGSTSTVADAAKKNLVRTIARSRFRPRVSDGRVADHSPVVVRYYLAGPGP